MNLLNTVWLTDTNTREFLMIIWMFHPFFFFAFLLSSLDPWCSTNPVLMTWISFRPSTCPWTALSPCKVLLVVLENKINEELWAGKEEPASREPEFVNFLDVCNSCNSHLLRLYNLLILKQSKVKLSEWRPLIIFVSFLSHVFVSF